MEICSLLKKKKSFPMEYPIPKDGIFLIETVLW